MSRLSVFSSPLLLGFDELERMLDRASKTSGDGYPPYNIERLARAEAARQVRDGDAVIAVWVLVNHNWVSHSYLSGQFQPACRKMLRTVPIGRSFLGCGTVTRPGLVGCL